VSNNEDEEESTENHDNLQEELDRVKSALEEKESEIDEYAEELQKVRTLSRQNGSCQQLAYALNALSYSLVLITV
jgi:DNA-binding transcriptional MerR regulator